MTRPIRVLGINGSLREGSFTLLALRVALEGARQAGGEVSEFDLITHRLPFCDGGDADGDDPNVKLLRDAVSQTDGLILATPEYHGSCSGVLKNALDLLSFDEMEGKVCGIVSVLGGQSSSNALNNLRIVCRHVHAWVVPHQAAVPSAYRAFDEAGKLTDRKLADRVARVGTDVVKYATLLRENPELARVDED